MNRHQAIYKLYPNVVSINNEIPFDIDGNSVDIDETVVQDLIDKNIYKQQRAFEYPSITDQLDALWKGGEAAADMLARVQAVKDKYPKG